MKEIALTQGKVALVDDEDFEELSKFKWYAHKEPHTFYAMRQSRGSHKFRKKILMHRAIMHPPENLEIDHFNGNGLDNQKSNLRIVTTRINLQNRHTPKSSKYPGVYWEKQTQKWKAQIRINGIKKNIGRYNIEEDAARAYIRKCEELLES